MAALSIVTALLLMGAFTPGMDGQVRRVNPKNRPGELLGKLSQMTPEQREKALEKLPPARREQLAKRIQNFQQLSPEEQTRRLDRLQRLDNMPPQEQKQVRLSIKEFNALPQDRKKQLNQEMRRLNALPEDQRRERIESEEFRDRYTPAEQQMMDDLGKLLPAKK
jgi:hypothetical protein